MNSPYTCPRCGETDALRGERDGEDITVVCLTCDERWTRGAPRCKTCGGDDVVTGRQAMSRHPRGNQLAIVGWREILLCQQCDGSVADDWVSKNRRVPEGYVSRAVLDATEEVAPIDTPTAGLSLQAPTAAGSHRSPKTARRPTLPTTRRPTPAATPTAASRPSDPTLRQAVETFLLHAGASADSTAMLMLGTHLGSSTRLSELSRPGTAETLAAWFNRLYSARGSSREAASATLVAAFDHWRDQGWVSTDPAALLRGEHSA